MSYLPLNRCSPYSNAHSALNARSGMGYPYNLPLIVILSCPVLFSTTFNCTVLSKLHVNDAHFFFISVVDCTTIWHTWTCTRRRLFLHISSRLVALSLRTFTSDCTAWVLGRNPGSSVQLGLADCLHLRIIWAALCCAALCRVIHGS